jgi:geranylgeranyl reductase family protein
VHDVLVVGGGPAGASAALGLAQAGARVALLDRARFPRDKTCGGGLVRRALGLLPQGARQAVERECRRAEVHLTDAGLRFGTERNDPMIAMAMRAALDARLVAAAQEAGAGVEEGCEVLGLESRAGRVTLRTSRGPRDARFVVAADGALSALARMAGWPPPALAPALEAEVFVDDGALGRFGGAARFDVGAVPRGYGWVFPKGEHLSIGVAGMRPGARGLPALLDGYLASLGIDKVRHAWRKGFVIPVRPRPGPFVRGRMLLAGDAAGFAEPLTGEGITFALLSGRLGARALLEGDLDEARVGRAYRAAVAREILPELRWGRLLARLTYDCPGLRARLARWKGARFSEALTEVFTGATTYRRMLRSPRSYLRLVRS